MTATHLHPAWCDSGAAVAGPLPRRRGVGNIGPTSAREGHEADGSVAIALATELPAGVPEANWIPAPAGRFRLGLRVYYPGAAVAEGRWMPPPVRRV